MKKLLLLSLFFALSAQAQILNFPDAAFKAALLSATPANTIANTGSAYITIDINHDGEIEQSEADLVVYLNLMYQNIGSIEGIHQFTNLWYLECSNNNMSTADIHGMTQLRTFGCSHNQISGVNVSGCSNLYTLNVGYNPLQALDASNLYALQNLTLADNMTMIILSNCTSLPTFSYAYSSLNTLNVSGCTAMTSLSCMYNYMTSLDLSNLTSLVGINCSSNHLQTLNINGCLNLERLNCSDNQLTHLDVSSFLKLTQLNCKMNAIHDLDLSAQTHLTTLDCSYNDLYALNVKNGVNEALTFNQNPHLTYMCVDESQNTSGLQYIAGPTVNINTYCSFVPGGNYNVITGKVRFDANNNGCDAGDATVYHSGMRMVQGANQNTIYTNHDGNYNFYPLSGLYTVTPFTEHPSWFAVTPPSVTVPFANTNNTTMLQDFCISAVGVHNDLEVFMYQNGPARPGFDASYKLVYKNKGNQKLTGTVSFNYDDSVLDFVSAAIAPNMQAMGSLTWNFTDLLPFETHTIDVVLNVNSPMETPAVTLGQNLGFSADITPLADDESPLDNHFNWHQIVTGSLDPNDKVCLEGSEISTTVIGDYLHYVINFENTGTAAAENVVVSDLIDANTLDVASLAVLNASHPLSTKVTGNKVEFIFENVNLAPQQKGNVVFKIKTKNTLAEGSVVYNKANIYFDYNFPVLTNTAASVFTVLAATDFENDRSVGIYPNPASDFVTVQSDRLIKSVQLFDVAGRIISTRAVNENKSEFDLSRLPKGTYLMKVITDQSIQTAKLIRK